MSLNDSADWPTAGDVVVMGLMFAFWAAFAWIVSRRK